MSFCTSLLLVYSTESLYEHFPHFWLDLLLQNLDYKNAYSSPMVSKLLVISIKCLTNTSSVELEYFNIQKQ